MNYSKGVNLHKEECLYTRLIKSDERADISRATLWKVEKGDKTVAIGIYAAVLHTLNGMDKDLLLVAKDDILGRTIQDLNLTVRKRAPRKNRL